MNYWNKFVSNLGQQNAPFGFDAQPVMGNPSQFDPAYNAGMQMIGNVGMGMLASGEKNPLRALGRSYLVAQQNAQEQNKNQFLAAQMLQAADEKKRQRQEEQDKKAQFDAWVNTLPPDQQGLAKLFPEKYGAEMVAQQFPDPQGAGGGNEFGLQPVALADKNGKFIGWGQMSKSGGLFYNNMPIDGNGDIRPMDPSSLNFAKSSGTAQGTASGEATAGAPGDIAAADLALGKINDLRADPNRAWGTGASAIFNSIPATPGYDYQAKVDEVTAGAFLTAIQQMRGLGQLSNTEGQTAKSAVTRMKTATSEEAFLEALNDYEDVVLRGKQRAQARLQNVPVGAPQPQVGAPAAPSAEDPLGLR